MERIDWFKINERSQQKYANFMAALASLGTVLEDADRIVKAYTDAYETERPTGYAVVEPEELKDAAEDLTASLNSLVAKGRKHEAKLKAWEWS
ncbi:hypothetical protein [Glycomyces artemisiae]|uniref:Uncharacterized protein n=1 Tax=Glycomyces artemisiae TaxID=1076443 RepID=A0A2T0UXI6_9ACTN|nr:hypothetical protein [Glycomyces artemisiae]PRY62558.1 hypothetical protein B0I28_101892 [Glycomyces artemisiae]